MKNKNRTIGELLVVDLYFTENVLYRDIFEEIRKYPRETLALYHALDTIFDDVLKPFNASTLSTRHISEYDWDF